MARGVRRPARAGARRAPRRAGAQRRDADLRMAVRRRDLAGPVAATEGPNMVTMHPAATGNRPARNAGAAADDPFWSRQAGDVLRQLGSTPEGLSGAEARRRAAAEDGERLRPRGRAGNPRLFLAQLKSPIILLLLLSAGLSAFLGERTDALIILVIVLGSGFLSFWQERDAADTVAQLLAVIETTVAVRRDGVESRVPLDGVVAGDVVLLSAGDAIPGDALLLDERDLFVEGQHGRA